VVALRERRKQQQLVTEPARNVGRRMFEEDVGIWGRQELQEVLSKVEQEAVGGSGCSSGGARSAEHVPKDTLP
jgi:hypothetical protein